MVHIFSHIHQTYVIYSVTVPQGGDESLQCAQPVKWVTKQQFLEAAVSTAMKKVNHGLTLPSLFSVRNTYSIVPNSRPPNKGAPYGLRKAKNDKNDQISVKSFIIVRFTI